jgi:hypothetical protein
MDHDLASCRDAPAISHQPSCNIKKQLRDFHLLPLTMKHLKEQIIQSIINSRRQDDAAHTRNKNALKYDLGGTRSSFEGNLVDSSFQTKK